MHAWTSCKINLSAFDLINQLPALKDANPWMKEIDSQSLQASIRNLDRAYNNFFSGRGFPKFKSKRKSVQSFQCPNGKREIDWVNSTLSIPKIPDIPINLSRKFEGAIKIVTIRKTITGKYYASILIDNKTELPATQPITEATTIGIDVGIKSFVVTSDGRYFEPNRELEKNLNRLKCLQRRFSRKEKGSNNRKKASLAIAKLHERISNSRLDYIHKVTHALTHDKQVCSIAIENLNVKGLIKNGTLAKAISDVSFGKFFEILRYKCDWYGKNLILIDMFAPSSKRCSRCGEINKDLTLDDRSWICYCGTHHERDLNAAINIKWFGLNNAPVDSRDEPVESRRIRRAKRQEGLL